MSKALDIEIIAEGIETVEQFNFIKSNNCDEAQGYYMSKPLPAEMVNDADIAALLNNAC